MHLWLFNIYEAMLVNKEKMNNICIDLQPYAHVYYAPASEMNKGFLTIQDFMSLIYKASAEEKEVLIGHPVRIDHNIII